jgi:chromosome segregation ATPase
MTVVRRITGLLLMIAAVIGLVFSILALATIWRVEPTLITNLQNVVTLLNQTMQTTSDGLSITKDALTASVNTVANLQTSLETTATTLESTDPLLTEVVDMMQKQLPDTIRATQQSLTTAQSSAQVIDSLLGSLSKIPLIGSSIGYKPEVPLSDALGQVAQSLNGLPDSFANMEDSLRNTQGNIQKFQADMTVMADSVGQIKSSVAQYEQVVDNYQASIAQVQSQLTALSAGVPQMTRALMLGLTVFLVWMAIAQLGLFTQGFELLTESVRRDVVEEIAEASENVLVVEAPHETHK